MAKAILAFSARRIVKLETQIKTGLGNIGGFTFPDESTPIETTTGGVKATLIAHRKFNMPTIARRKLYAQVKSEKDGFDLKWPVSEPGIDIIRYNDVTTGQLADWPYVILLPIFISQWHDRVEQLKIKKTKIAKNTLHGCIFQYYLQTGSLLSNPPLYNIEIHSADMSMVPWFIERITSWVLYEKAIETNDVTDIINFFKSFNELSDTGIKFEMLKYRKILEDIITMDDIINII